MGFYSTIHSLNIQPGQTPTIRDDNGVFGAIERVGYNGMSVVKDPVEFVSKINEAISVIRKKCFGLNQDAINSLSKTERYESLGHRLQFRFSEGTQFSNRFNLKVILDSIHGDRVYVSIRLCSKSVWQRRSISKDKEGGGKKVFRQSELWVFTKNKITMNRVCALGTRPNVNLTSILREVDLNSRLMELQKVEDKEFVPEICAPPFVYLRKRNGGSKICIHTTLCNGGNMLEMQHTIIPALRKLPTTVDTHVIMLKLMLEVSRALVFIHKSGYIHADIKPDNIFLITSSSLGEIGEDLTIDPRIGDFDLSFAHQEDISSRNGFGTTPYLPPELIKLCYSRATKNEPLAGQYLAQLSFPIDNWALGCTFYTLLISRFLPWAPLIEAFNDLRKVYLDSSPKPNELEGDIEKEFINKINAFVLKITNFEVSNLALISVNHPFSEEDDYMEILNEINHYIKVFCNLSNANQMTPNLQESLVSLFNATYLKLENLWDCLEKVPKPDDPLDALIWSLLRPNQEQRSTSLQALNKVIAMMPKAKTEVVDPKVYGCRSRISQACTLS